MYIFANFKCKQMSQEGPFETHEMDQNLDLFIRSQGEHVGLLLSLGNANDSVRRVYFLTLRK